MRVITVAAQKGGTGKTTSAAAIAQGASTKGKKALLIDLDPQGSLTHIIGAKAGNRDLLQGQNSGGLVQRLDGQPDIIPASMGLAAADIELANRPGRDFLLRKALQTLKGYDLTIIDTPPHLGTLLINALTAATDVVIPLQADTFAIQGLFQLTETIQQVQQYTNPTLRINGVILTRYSARTVHARDLREAIAAKCETLGIPLLQSIIREGVAIREAQTLQRSIFDYAPKSNPARDYEALINELEV